METKPTSLAPEYRREIIDQQTIDPTGPLIGDFNGVAVKVPLPGIGRSPGAVLVTDTLGRVYGFRVSALSSNELLRRLQDWQHCRIP